MADARDSRSVPQGRAQRLGKLARLGAKVGSRTVKARLSRALGRTKPASTSVDDAIYETLGELKGAALKIGQTLSMGTAGNANLDARNVLSKLFSEAPTLPFQDISDVIRNEFGTSADRVFRSFSSEPIAAASLGQVHRAQTQEGDSVAVKVQYPGVENAVRDDLGNLSALVGTLGLGSNVFDGKNYLQEIRDELSDELNYRHERERLERFHRYVREWDDFVVPEAYPSYSTKRVLTMSLLEGLPLHRYIDANPDLSEPSRFRIAEQLVRAVFGPFLLHRVIHADTHPGNFIVMDDEKLGIVDFGSVKEFSDEFWCCYRDAIRAWVENDHADLLPLVRKGGFTVSMPDRAARELLQEIAGIAGRPMTGPYDFGQCTIVEDLGRMAARRATELLRVRPPSEGILFFRALTGLTHNLKLLKANGDFRPTVRRLLERAQ